MCISGRRLTVPISMYHSIRAAGGRPFLHVVFYPDFRLMVHCYKKIISGSRLMAVKGLNCLYKTCLIWQFIMSNMM